MMYSAEPERTKRIIIVLRYPAWQECGQCQGVGLISFPDGHDNKVHAVDGDCPNCSGSGGWWHPKVNTENRYEHFPHVGSRLVNKSDTLILSGEACKACGGRGIPYGALCDVAADTPCKCESCKGTGIWGGEWKVNKNTQQWEGE